MSFVFFAVIPFVIYTLSYIPYTTANGRPLTAVGLIGDMWDNAKYMLDFHGRYVLEHQNKQLYSSPWWKWLLNIRPIQYFDRLEGGYRTIIAAFTNPLVTLGGLVALCIAMHDFFRKKVITAFVILVGYLAQLLPWVLVARTTFAYHYFPSVIFLILSICYIFNNIIDSAPERKWRVYAFTGVSAGLFFLLFPPTAGIPTPGWYMDWFARWLPSWPF